MFSVSHAIVTHECGFLASGSRMGICFILHLVRKLFPYLSGTVCVVCVSFADSFFVTFISEINSVLGYPGGIGVECTLVNICEICS